MMIHPQETDLARQCQALAHPIRVHLVRRLLRHGPRSVGQLVADTGLAQSTVSQHLAALRTSGLVVAEHQQRRHLHRVDPATLRRFAGLLAAMAASAPRDPVGPAK